VISRRWPIIIGALAVVIILAVVALTLNSSKIKQPGAFVIKTGAVARSVWRDLAKQGFTSSTLPWYYHGWLNGSSTNIQAGTYQLESNELVKDIINRFNTGDVSNDELSITYPEGFTVSQMAARTAAKDIGTEAEFLNQAKDLEGYLFPDTYRVFADDTPADVIKRMRANFDQKLTDDLLADIEKSGRTMEEVIIMASIVEREVQTDADMAKVAGALWARFDDGVGLAADATVRYALNKWDDPLTVQDLQIESPYNTRRFAGLPPGPISNPGLRAIIAAIRPEKSDFYYYLSAPSGETIFSKTLEEHNLNKAKYLR